MDYRHPKWMAIVLGTTLMLGACSDRAAEAPAATAMTPDQQARSALEQRRLQVEADQKAIGSFQVVSTRYHLVAQESGWQRPTLDLVLDNHTELAVKRFTLLVTLASPGRSEPWFRQELRVPGEIAPGARHETTLTPTPDSPWALAQPTGDATMQVDVVSVEADDGKVYLGPGSFGEKERAELDALAAKAD